jgi:hypothetical protein
MVSQFLDERKKGLEESFFAKHNRELLEAMRKKTDAAARRAELISISGIRDQALLDELVGLGLDAAGLAALSLIPLLQVAWADGAVQKRERDALLEAARKSGIEAGAPAHQLLIGWLDSQPEPRLFQAWKDYIRALRDAMSDESIAALRTEVLSRAKAVARAAGGILGVGGTLGSEQRVIDQLEAVFTP